MFHILRITKDPAQRANGVLLAVHRYQVCGGRGVGVSFTKVPEKWNPTILIDISDKSGERKTP